MSPERDGGMTFTSNRANGSRESLESEQPLLQPVSRAASAPFERAGLRGVKVTGTPFSDAGASQPCWPPGGHPTSAAREPSTPLLQVPSQQDLAAHAAWHTPAERVAHWWRRRWEHEYSKYGTAEWASLVLPCISWLRSYNWSSYLQADLVAGLTVGVMTVPQSLSYARIAGLPSQFGLYGAFAPVLGYALFGSSRQLAVGPVAIVSLLLSNGLTDIVPGAEDNWEPNEPINPSAQESYNIAAVQVSLLVAAMYVAVGALRLGFLTNFLSHSVLSGFTTGAAAVIGISQIKLIFGFHVPRDGSALETIQYLVTHLRETQPLELALGCTWLLLLLSMKHLGMNHGRLQWMRPLGPLTVAVLSILCVWGLELDVRTVGAIPAGLPPVTISWWFPPEVDWWDLVKVAGTLTLVGLMESIAIAKALAAQHKHPLDANQELIGLGMANLAGAAFCCYPSTGGFSRSAVNADSGAKSGLAGAVTAGVVGCVLALLTGLTRHMPLNAMGAIVLAGVSGLLNFSESAFLWRVAKLDWAVWAVSLAGTLVAGAQVGLGISIALALMFVIYESATPNVVQLGRLPGTRVYRNVRQYAEAEAVPGMLLVRIGAPIYFANTQHISERLRRFEARAQEAAAAAGGPRVQFLVLDLSPVQHVDASAVRVLFDLAAELHSRGIQFVAANPSDRVAAMFERSGLLDALGPDPLFVRVHDAVEHCRHLLAENAAEQQRDDQQRER